MKKKEYQRARRHAHTEESVRALRWSSNLSQIAVILGAVESVGRTAGRSKPDYLPWRIARTRLPRVLRGRIAELIFSHTGDRLVTGLRLLSASALLFSRHTTVRRSAHLAVGTTQLYQSVRNATFGLDGSDQALVVQQATQIVAAFTDPSSPTNRAARGFMAGQTILSYTASGIVKWASPVWRSGDALVGITRAVTYGDPRTYEVMRKYRAVRVIGAWAVIVGETVAPVVILMPRPVRLAWQASMGIMHLVIASTMGLNRFFWAFLAFHPVLDQTVNEARASVAATRATTRRGRTSR